MVTKVDRTPPQVKPAYLGIPEAAAYVGVGIKSIRNLLDSGKLTRYRPVGRRVVISFAELENYMRTSAER